MEKNGECLYMMLMYAIHVMEKWRLKISSIACLLRCVYKNNIPARQWSLFTWNWNTLAKLHSGNSITLLERKVKHDEDVKYLPNNLCDGFKVDRDKRSIPPERREDTRVSPFSSTAEQVLTAAINNEAQLKGRPPAKSVAKRWKWCRVVG